MEKLIELLNEYVEKHNKSDLDYTFELDKDNGLLFCYDDTTDHKGWSMQDEAMVICSKQFGFIKWLVYEDKIDHEKIKSGELNGSKWFFETVQPEYFVIMLLAISENPIDLLCERLK